MDRVLLNQQGLIISKPGVDVNASNFGQQIFNSGFSQLMEYQRFTHNSPSTGWVKNNIGGADGRNWWFKNYDIAFPKTFADVPMVFILATFAAGSNTYWSGRTFMNSGLGQFFYENGQFGSAFTEAVSLSITVSNNKLAVSAQTQEYGNPTGFSLKYRILEQTQ
ncbi:hypothetical protein [Maritalea sp.]|jgi:hypothetical protein|uniref:hypothetical protein n=1 Tax=Maritalea sp. TaxID=2003361 RepID=UPI0039E3FA55